MTGSIETTIDNHSGIPVDMPNIKAGIIKIIHAKNKMIYSVGLFTINFFFNRLRIAVSTDKLVYLLQV